ncbi:MAG: IPT/TIG domain-containing protein, partial [Methanoregula sp.]
AGPVAGGTPVTITGTGFTGATTVMFGTTGATSYTVVSATSITAVSPAGTGTVDVTVTTPGGTSTTSAADEFMYDPIPTVTGITPTGGPLAGGTTVTITGTGFTGATAVTFGTTAATSYTVASATSITAVSPAGSAGTVDVTVTTPGGTSTTSAADQFTYDPVPTPTPTSPSGGGGAGGNDESGNFYRPTSFAVTAPGTTAGQTMTFAINEVLSEGDIEYPYAIISVQVVPSQSLGPTQMTLTDAGTPDASQLPGRQTAGIVTIELVGVNPVSVSQVTVNFEVAGTWLTQHGLTPDNIVFMRNSGGGWSELPTTFVTRNGDAYYFTATTPGLSSFAITSRVNTATDDTSVLNTTVVSASPPAAVTGAPLPTTAPVTIQTASVTAATSDLGSSVSIPDTSTVAPTSTPLGIWISLLAIVTGIVCLRRK